MFNWLDEVIKLREENISFGVITLVNVKGSSPQDIGARAIVTQNGLIAGTVGGGKIESHAIKHVQAMILSSKKFDFCEWNLQTDIGMTCGGVVSLSFEVETAANAFTIAVFGAGHVAQELVRVLSNINCNIICIDPRVEWLDKLPNKKNIKKVQTNSMNEVISSLDENTFVASLTMGHAFDRPILAAALKRKFPFIGAIGSDQKAIVLKKELKEIDLIDEQNLLRLVCPIGEKFGSNAPYEIAISITAQLLIARDHKLKQ